jgi:hypothetical protein
MLNNMDCCELALYNAKLARSIAIGAFITIVLCLAIVRNYYVKMKGLTVELKKKNGKELKRIEGVEHKNEKLQEKIQKLEKFVF